MNITFQDLDKSSKNCVRKIISKIRNNNGEEVNATVISMNTTNVPNSELEEIVFLRLQAMMNNPAYQDVLKDVEKLEQYAFDEMVHYRVCLKNKAAFALSSENLLQRQKFDAAYMAATNKVPIGDATDYRIFIANLISGTTIKKEIKEKDTDELGELVDAVYRFIDGATVVSKLDACAHSVDNVFVDGEKLMVPSSSIRRIMNKEESKCSLRKLRVALDEVLEGSSKKIRLSEKTNRFWVFNITKLPGEIKLKLVREDDENGQS